MEIPSLLFKWKVGVMGAKSSFKNHLKPVYLYLSCGLRNLVDGLRVLGISEELMVVCGNRKEDNGL